MANMMPDMRTPVNRPPMETERTPVSAPSLNLAYVDRSFSPDGVTNAERTSYTVASPSRLGHPIAWRGHEHVPGPEPHYTDFDHSFVTDGQYYSSHSFDSEDGLQTSPATQRPSSALPAAGSSLAMTWTPDSRSGQRPRKQARATQACENCRLKKSRCDEKHPQCGHCANADIKCVYKEPKSGKKDQHQAETMKRLESVEKLVKEMDKRTLETQRSNEETNEDVKFIKKLLMQHCLQRQSGQTLGNDGELSDQIFSLLPEEEDDSDSDVLKGNESIPPHHSTPAHKLVNYWKGIKSFYRNIPDVDYVMRGEMEREPLSCSARPKFSRKAMSDSKRSSQMSSPLSSPTRSIYEVKLGDDIQDESRKHPSTPVNGGPRREVEAMLEKNEVHKAHDLWASYQRNIHILQPFLSIGHVSRIIKRFGTLGRAEPSMSRRGSEIPSLKNGNVTGEKRKWNQDSASTPESSYTVAGQPLSWLDEDRKIDTAMILFIFALGEICEVTTSLGIAEESVNGRSAAAPSISDRYRFPELTSTPPPIRLSTFRKAGLHLHGLLQDSRPFSLSASACEILDGYVSIEKESTPAEIRANTVPGLQYYLAGTRILGELSGSTKLFYIHSQLLAGLYASQLMRPKESWKWIHSASTIMQDILNANPQALDHKVKEDNFSNQIRTTYWSCQQLESDMLAELNFTQSGISRFEDRVPLPGDPDRCPGDILDSSIDQSSIMGYFFQQIYLRRTLNRSHAALYAEDGPGNLKQRIGWREMNPKELMGSLDAWITSLQDRFPGLCWDESDDPPTDINDARMRAKYYGGKVIINRNFLKTAIEAYEQRGWSVHASFTSEATDDTGSTLMDPPEELDAETIEGARQCVSALIKSTVAFDSLVTMPDRLIVTNPFGTAQAQFGNILVLARVVLSESFTDLISKSDFDHLFKRTRRFLATFANLSPIMRTNLLVLENVRTDLRLPN